MGDYSWQKKAVARHADDRISAIVAACGTGKTRVGIKLALAKFARRHLPVIIIVPKNLTRQWRDDILEIAGPEQKVWVYDSSEYRKRGAAYERAFVEWLKEGSDETGSGR